MSAIGLVLGLAAYVVMWKRDVADRADNLEFILAGISMALGIVALTLAETAAAEVLLAVFMGSILVVWAVKLADHAGVLDMAQQSGPN